MNEIRTGDPDIDTKSLGHTPGISDGHKPGAYASQDGHLPDGRSTAARSTGVNPEGMEPIDPSMPNLSPG
jgi:hypothetical protein